MRIIENISKKKARYNTPAKAEAPNSTCPTRPIKAVSVMLMRFCTKRLTNMGREILQISLRLYMQEVKMIIY